MQTATETRTGTGTGTCHKLQWGGGEVTIRRKSGRAEKRKRGVFLRRRVTVVNFRQRYFWYFCFIFGVGFALALRKKKKKEEKVKQKSLHKVIVGTRPHIEEYI